MLGKVLCSRNIWWFALIMFQLIMELKWHIYLT